MDRINVNSKEATRHSQQLVDRIERRRAELLQAKCALRTRFAGLDEVIEQVVDAMASWYCLPEVQTRPRVIGLWGMTGTGKSAVVSACLDLLGFRERSCWLDAGQSRDREWLSEAVSTMGAQLDGQPMVMVIDEFQHARTIIQGEEITETSAVRELWELIDTGRFRTWPSGFHVSGVKDLRDLLATTIKEGVEVEDGRVVRGVEVHARCLKEAHILEDRAGRDAWFVPDMGIDQVRDMVRNSNRSRDEVRHAFRGLDGPASIARLNEFIDAACSMQEIDASKALIVVLGNLDEMYVAGKEIWPEIDAGILRIRHARMDESKVQEALARLFRIEQVGRLGSDHVLFPPMDRSAGIRAVQVHAERIGGKIKEELGFDLRFSISLCAHIYDQYAIPVFGARPLVTAVQQVVPQLAAEAIVDLAAGSSPDSAMVLCVEEGDVVVRSSTGTMPLRWPGRQPVRSEPVNERVAVHEAGHVLVGHFVSGWRPLQVCVRRGTDHEGFVIWDDDGTGPLLRSQVVGRLAMALGGYVAERLHYGEDGLSAGSGSDLNKATRLAFSVINQEGFGRRACVHVPREGDPTIGFREMRPEVEEQAMQWLEEAEVLARTLLQKEKRLFAEIVKALLLKRSLNAEELDLLIDAHHLNGKVHGGQHELTAQGWDAFLKKG